MKIQSQDRLLFIGDSITDVHRNRNSFTDLGNGYPQIIAKHFSQKMSQQAPEFLNRGISGNQLVQLRKRWQEDCLNLNPDIVSILIGINDVWHFMREKECQKLLTPARLAAFENDYRYLLNSLHDQGITRIILMEPFVLPFPEDRLSWRKHLDPRIHIIRNLAAEFQAYFVPLDGPLNALGIKNGYEIYTGKDGVHPTPLGHEKIAEIWIDSVIGHL